MKRSVMDAYRNMLAFRNLVILVSLSLLVAIKPSAAANFSLQNASISPTAIPLAQSFTFTVTLTPSVTISNAIVALDIKDPSATNLLLQKYVTGQNFVAGQPVSYSWTGILPPGQTKSVPFVVGNSYDMFVYVFNSTWSSQYLPGTVATAFTVAPQPPPVVAAAVPAYVPAATNVGYTATPPIAPPAGTGNTYYVSDPSNAATNLLNLALLPPGATVFPTLQAAADVTNPGDTVEIMNGTYQPNPAQWVQGVLVVNHSGSATGGYITYEAYPGHHPIVTTANSSNIWDTIHLNASYIVIQGLQVVGSAQSVTLGFATQTAATEEAALQQEAAAGQPADLPSGPTKDITNGDCIAGTEVTHIIVVQNLVHDCSGAGIDLEESDYSTVEANTVYNTSWWTMYDTSGIALHLALNSDSTTGYRNYVLDNISYDNGNTQPFMYDQYNNDVNPGSAPTTPTDGNGIIIDTNQTTNDGTPYVGRTLVAGNIAYGNGGAGIVSYRSSHVDLINNTAYLNDTCPVPGSTCGAIDKGQLFSNVGNDINIFDNIGYAPLGDVIYTNYNNSNIAENYNILYGTNVSPTYTSSGQTVLQGVYDPAAQDIVANPSFSNTAKPFADNFVFATGAPGINAGTSYTGLNISIPALLGLQVTGGKVNIGAGQ